MLVLAYYSLASITRLTRSACLSEMNKEYISLARAKGRRDDDSAAPCPAQYPRHSADGDRSRPTSMLEGAVLTETVFVAGIGRYLTTALFAGDTTAIMAARCRSA